MSKKIKDRHLYGAGAAACAVCCAPPLLALLGIVGALAPLATVAFAGIAFGLVVLSAPLLGLWARGRRTHGSAAACAVPDSGLVDVTIGTAPTHTH